MLPPGITQASTTPNDMAQKAKARTGGALPTLAEPEEDSDATTLPGNLTDAQATDVKPSGPLGGFNATPQTPIGPPFPPSMGGESTKPSDFARQVNAATAVQSKGGPPVEDLYASSGKGPVGQLKTPRESAAVPRSSAEPQLRGLPGNAPVPGFTLEGPEQPQVAPSQSAATPSQPTSDQGQPAAQELPAFANPNRRAAIQKYVADKHYLSGDQDYSKVDPYISHDPSFAGLDGGVPVFMDEDNKPYYRDESQPGKGVKHYFEEPAGTEVAKNGHPYEEPDKMQAAQDARDQLTAMLQTQEAINKWKQLQAAYAKANGDEAWYQRPLLAAKMSGDEGWQAAIAKALSGAVGITPKMEELDAARNNMVIPYKTSFEKSKEGLRISGAEIGGVPTASDDFTTQVTKVQAMEDQLRSRADALRMKYPYASQKVEQLLGMIRSGEAPQTRSAGTPARSGATPGATPSAQVSQAEIDAAPHPKTAADLAQLKSGDLFIDLDGKPKRKH
jgi:hypothetical protein